MLFAASISTWAYDSSNPHITVKKVGVYTWLTIKECDPGWTRDQNGRWVKLECNHSLKEIIDAAQITEADKIDLIRVNLLNTPSHKIIEGVPYLKAYTIDLRKAMSLKDGITLGSWKNIKNQYCSNVLLQYDSELGLLDNSVVENFNPERLYNVIVLDDACQPCKKANIDAYVNKPGYLANGLQYVNELSEDAGYGYHNGNSPMWYNDRTPNGGNGYEYYPQTFKEVRISGYVFACDLMAQDNEFLTEDGHMRPFPRKITYQDRGPEYRPGSRCDNQLAPSYSDPNAIYFDEPGKEGNSGHLKAAMHKSRVRKLDLTNAQFGEWKEENGKKVFKYYPADMTVSMLYEVDKDDCIEELYLPTSPTQYIIPEGFIHDSKNVHDLCIPSNYTEIDRYAFLGARKDVNGKSEFYGIDHFTTTATEVDEQKQLFNGIKKGDIIDYGDKTLTLPSTTKFVGRGAFSGYDGAAHLEDVYVLAENAPYCEFFAFDQKTYVGDNFHHQGHLIKKGNYVDANMAMLHFPNTTSRIEMLNYSDMTRKYRLYDETGHYDNMGNILVWPTQAQYNRSFNQALGGVTWWAWKENLNGVDDPENAYSAGNVAGTAYANANHEFVFSKAASDEGFSDKFTLSFDGANPNSSFNPYEYYGRGNGTFDDKMAVWDAKLLSKAVPESETDRPLSYDWIKYGGWHQFVITELYDFLLDDPIPGPRPDYYNFARYNKNIWYGVCFPFNLTKAQLLKALGNPESGEYPVVSTLAGVTRDAEKLGITIHMSKNLLNYKVIYEDDNNTVKADLAHGKYVMYENVNYGDDDIVIEANRPYFVLPCLPEEELEKAAKGYRRSEVTYEKDKIMFPIPTRVRAVDGKSRSFVDGQDKNVQSNTSYTYNYYFVGNNIPQTMPENAYYLAEYQKKNGEYWSSFYHNSPKKTDLMWQDNESIVMAVVEDLNGSNSKGFLERKQIKYNGVDHNYIWNASPYYDWIFFKGTGNPIHAKTAFGIQVEDNYTTSIELPVDMEEVNAGKVYNLNGQFVGIDANKMAKGIYIVGGKKIVK